LFQKKFRDIGDKEMRNIANLKADKLLLKAFAELAEILNLFSSRSFSFLNLALLGFFGKIPAEFFDSR
jgi:hypothetical protein